MADGFEALTEVTLAIARAAAERDAAFAASLGTRLRQVLVRQALQPSVFEPTFRWLSRFETDAGEPQPAADETPDHSDATTSEPAAANSRDG